MPLITPGSLFALSLCHVLAQVPIGELEGLGLELEKLSELESIRGEWQLQAQAQDEVRNG